VDDQRSTTSDHDDAVHDQNAFRQLWVPAAEAADWLSFEPAQTFARRALEWLKRNETMPSGS
jgi:hypothetical protein